jgi:plastocyanin
MSTMCKATTRWRLSIQRWRNSEKKSQIPGKFQKEKEDEKCQIDLCTGGNPDHGARFRRRGQAGLGGNESDKSASAAEVKIDNFSFGPTTLTVPAGTTITWKNNDDVPHVVSSDDGKMFKSKALDTDDHFSFTFTKPGTYNYYCAIHPKMTAKIVVQ